MRKFQRAERVFLFLANMRSTELAQRSLHPLQAAEFEVFLDWFLYQGTTLVVPKMTHISVGFSPC